MLRLPLTFLALVLAFSAPARAEPLLVDLSEHLVRITTGFTGTRVLLFGAIDGEGQVVVVVQGPRQQMSVRRKDRVAGIWVNTREVSFVDVPAFYQVLSSDTLDEWLPLRVRDRYQVGVEYLNLRPVGRIGPAEAADFREAMIRNLQRIGRYGVLEGNVTILRDRLFRADLYFPANLPTGYYNIEVLLMRDGEVRSVKSTPLLVSRAGIGADVYRIAHAHPALYGIVAVILAVVAGLGANVIFRNI